MAAVRSLASAVSAAFRGAARRRARRTPAIVFVGFMGAGKTKAALAATELGLEAVDADELVERELGMPIGEFFEREGAAAFRAREEEVMASLLERTDGQAVAAGGGSILSPRVREAMERHVVVWLDVDPDAAWERVQHHARPLARDEAGFRALLGERRPLYEAVADVVIAPAERERVRQALPAILALRDAPPGTRMLWARSASGEYPVLIGEGLLGAVPWPVAGRRFCVTDSTVGPLYAGRLDGTAAVVAVEPGEERKTLAEVERVLRELAAAGMRRDDHLVALGGGVVGDLAGFCAAIYQRGVPIVQVPTTLVAQVDSAYGGKTGVDLPEAKNYAGAYHMPAAVLADTSTLGTLPPEELRAGFAEVLKTALIAGGELWEAIRALEPGAPPPVEVIAGCVRTKLDVVAADERDAGERAVLNLGHTVGHAIEAATGYGRYRHGEAVALGLLAALRLSGADELRAEVVALLGRHGLPASLDPAAGVDGVLAAIERDKKRTGAGVGFVLLERPGEPRTGQLVEPGRVRAAVEELR